MVQLAAVGNTIPVALDGAFKLNQLGIAAVAGDIWESQTAYTFNLGPEDVILIISNSGSSKRLMTLAQGAKGERVHGHTDYQQQQFTPGSHIRLPDCHCHQGKASDRGVLVLKGNGHSGGGDTVPAFDGRKDRCGGPYTPP